MPPYATLCNRVLSNYLFLLLKILICRFIPVVFTECTSLLAVQVTMSESDNPATVLNLWKEYAKQQRKIQNVQAYMLPVPRSDDGEQTMMPISEHLYPLFANYTASIEDLTKT